MREEKKTNREELQNHHQTSNKMSINTYLSTIILNVNGLNTLIKRHRVLEWIKKTRHIDMLSIKDSF